MLDKDKVDVEIIDVVDEDKQWRADSEYMDSKDDTWLLNKLFEKFKSMLVCF